MSTIIGIPREIMPGEGRVAATPDTVRKLRSDGFSVLIERGAGLGSRFVDERYVEAGATILGGAAEVFREADIILKVKEPQFNAALNRHEADMFRAGQMLIAFIHPAAPANREMIQRLAASGVTALTLDGVPRISRAQNMDALTSMSTCAGYKGMLMAANDLGAFVPPMFSAGGAIKPASVLVVGAGVAGLQAIATAKRLGAQCYAIDIRPDALEQAASLGAKPVDSGVPAERAVGQGGYAQALTEQWLAVERSAIARLLPQMDIVFLSALVPSKRAPVLIDEAMLKTMKLGSVIVDVSIDQGGNCSETAPGERCVKHGVVIEGIKNIPGLLPQSATAMFATNIYNLIAYLYRGGSLALDPSDPIVRGILTTQNGKIVHEGALEVMEA